MEKKNNNNITLSDIMNKLEETKDSLGKEILINRKFIEENRDSIEQNSVLIKDNKESIKQNKDSIKENIKTIDLISNTLNEILKELKDHRIVVPELINDLSNRIEHLPKSTVFKSALTDTILRSEDNLEAKFEQNYGVRIENLEISTKKIKKKIGMK